jgi:hypothetical protein
MGFNIFIKKIGWHFQISMEILDFFKYPLLPQKNFFYLSGGPFFNLLTLAKKNVQNGIFKISFSYLFPNSKTQLDMKLFFIQCKIEAPFSDHLDVFPSILPDILIIGCMK